MIKKFLCLCLVAFMAFGFCSCGGVKGAEARLFYPIDRDPEYLDPQIIYDNGAKNIIANCFEGLVAFDSEGNIIPAAAEKWETNVSDTVYTFFLRKDMKWKVTSAAGKVIGEEEEAEKFDSRVTAKDFAFALKRAILPETICPGADNLFSILNAREIYKGNLDISQAGIRVIDDYTLEITLESPDPDFLCTLTESYCMPCNEEFFEKTGGRYGLATRYLLYNGPFYINNWADDSSVSVRKNNDYYDADNVYPYSVYFSINNEQPTRLKKLTDDTYSVSPMTKAQAKALEGKRNFSVVSFPSSALCFVFNCSDPNLSNVNIRRGIVSSIDYSVLEESFGPDDTVGIVPGCFRTGALSFSEYRATADRYLNASPLTVFSKGLKKLDTKGIEVTVLCTPENENTVRTLMQHWQSVLGVGFTVYVETTDEVNLKERVRKGDYQLALTDVRFTGNTVYSVLSSFTSYGKANFTFFSDKKYDKLVENIKRCNGIATFSVACRDAEEYLTSACVIVPVKNTETYCAMGKKVSGVIFNPSGEILYFRNTVKK